MVIVEFSGGLGNQMFQYALYLKLKKLGKDVKADTSLFNFKDSLRKFELKRVFDVSPETVDAKDAALIRGYGSHDTLLDKIRYKLRRSSVQVYTDKIDVYQPDIFEMDNVLLSGYWQSPLYFEGAADEIRDTFLFCGIDDKNTRAADEMDNCNSVSIHVRRSDYLNYENNAIYGNICTVEYYKNAIEIIRERVNDPVFYVFSDDPVWAKENIMEEGMILMEGNTGDDAYKDMYLMSNCYHHIIANSSFSWWGAYLGSKNSESITVCPSKWFNNHETTQMICDGWIPCKG